MRNSDAELNLLGNAAAALAEGFANLPDFDAAVGARDFDRMREVLVAAAERMRDNDPYHHPLYIGQMLKPPHPVARLAHALAGWINPNNHALDGGRASSAMEKEVVVELGRMFGFDPVLGHLTSGGTMANFEALWIARELAPGRAVAVSSQAHYTHARLSAVLQVPCVQVAVDSVGRMDPAALARVLEEHDVGTVVVTLGATATGAVDPLDAVLALQQKHGFRVHVDAAYGGYFTLVEGLGAEARSAFDAIGGADSVVIDPHKHGLQPYGCGCVLFRDPSVGRFYRHDSPYTYFSSDELHLGEISLECSRPGAAAVALWTTMQMLPIVRGGEFARGLEDCLGAASALYAGLVLDERWAVLFEPQLDIVTWAVRADTAAESSARARAVFESAKQHDLHLALATFPRQLCEAARPVESWGEASSLTCLRACAMKPEHASWISEILSRLERD